MRTQIFYFNTNGGNIRYNVQVVPSLVRTFVCAMQSVWTNDAFRNVRFHYADADLSIRRIAVGEYGYKVIFTFREGLV